uniref:Uncharacterized protein MANES_02G134500 n=1 Tax=Rhizophora mucronata TaxID=61149 RepID=A0A2P2NAV3_RHIMU
MVPLDYSTIDWSLERGLSLPRSGGLWMDSELLKSGTQMYDSNGSSMGVTPALRSVASGNGAPISGVASAETSAAGSHEWTSPFGGKDLFSLPRQFVSSPSL